MSNVIDYLGRKIDVLALRPASRPAVGGASLLVQELARPGDGGLICSGIQKLAQRTLLILLKKQGSSIHAPLEGTRFMLEAQAGRWRTASDVANAFYSARLDVLRQSAAAETADTPDDERLFDLQLDGVIVAPGAVTLRLTLVSDAGTTYTYLSPIPVTIR